MRQLKHAIELTFALSSGHPITVRVVRAALTMDAQPQVTEFVYAETERELLMVMEETQWDVPKAAQRLGVHRATIYRRLARLHTSKPRKNT